MGVAQYGQRWAVSVPLKVVRPPQFWQTISFSPDSWGPSAVAIAARSSTIVPRRSRSVGAASREVSMSASRPQLGQASFWVSMANTSWSPHCVHG